MCAVVDSHCSYSGWMLQTYELGTVCKCLPQYLALVKIRKNLLALRGPAAAFPNVR